MPDGLPAEILDGAVTLNIASPDRAEGLDELLNDPTVADWLGGPRTRETILRTIAEERQHWEQHRFGPWVLCDRAGAVIGRGGIRFATVLGRTEVELFYAVAPSWWNRGVATAMSEVALSLAFDRAGVGSVIGFTLESNVPSQRVMEKVGLVRGEVFEHAGLPHVMYRITAEDFRARHESGNG